ncbi:MAG: hypothetical protein ACRCTD_04930 [Beijerinckiaceae bacterium]
MMTLPRGPHDPIHRLLAINGLLGGAVGVGFAIGIYWLDVGHIQRLVANDSGGSIAMVLMTAGFVVTCASLAMGSAIMMMPRDDDKDPPQGGLRQETQPLVPQLVPARARARRYTATGSSR